MYAYCVQHLHLSEDAAFKRIRAARTARQFPAIFPAVADGRLSLSAVVLLTPCLTRENAGPLLDAAIHKSRAQIELLLAQRFPRPDVPDQIVALVPALPAAQLAPGPVAMPPDRAAQGPLAGPGQLAPAAPNGVGAEQVSPARLASRLAPGPVASPSLRDKVAPLAPGRFALQLTLGEATHEKLRYAQALLGHAVPSGDLAQVLDRALEALIQQLERKRFAAGARSRPARRRRPAPPDTSERERDVPAAVRRAVWQRDGGRCTFVSEQGHRCESRTRLELDHVHPVARGGQTTAENLRLRCRAHNQYAADCTYGAGFMREKREASRRRAARVAPSSTAPIDPSTATQPQASGRPGRTAAAPSSGFPMKSSRFGRSSDKDHSTVSSAALRG
jgi:hypothetical protein